MTDNIVYIMRTGKRDGLELKTTGTFTEQWHAASRRGREGAQGAGN